MLWITIICWVAPLTLFAILAEYYFYCRKYKNQSIDKTECDVAYMPEWKKAEYKKLCKNTKPVMLCKNCGANLNGRGKCEYCGTVYPENIFLIEQEPIIAPPTNKSNILFSETSENIKNIKSEIDKIKEETNK